MNAAITTRGMRIAAIRRRRRRRPAGGAAGTWPLAPGVSSVSGVTGCASRVKTACDPVSRRSKVRSNPLQRSQELGALLGPESVQSLLVDPREDSHEGLSQCASRGREEHLHRAPVVRAPLAPDQPLGFQTIQEARDRSAIRADIAGEGRGENTVALPKAVQDL